MKDQHKLIKGYRDLTQQEVDLINKVKSIGLELEFLINEVMDHRYNSNNYEIDRVESIRCAEIAKKDLQTGIMWLTRSIASPEGF